MKNEVVVVNIIEKMGVLRALYNNYTLFEDKRPLGVVI